MEKPSQPLEFLRKHKKATAVAAAAGAAAVVLTGITKGTHLRGDERHSSVHATVKDIEPIALDCRARMTTEVEARVSNSVNISAFGLSQDVKGTGFDSFLRGGNGKPGTKATVETLTCMEKPQVQIDNKARTVTIDSDSVQLFSRYKENESSVVTTDPPISAMGEGISKFVKGVTLGYVGLWDGFTNEQRARLESTTRQIGVNTVETKCAPDAWSLTQQVIEEAYKQQDPKVSVKWQGSVPSFDSPYDVDGDASFFKIDERKFAANDCVIDSDLLSQIQHDTHVYEPVAPQFTRAGE